MKYLPLVIAVAFIAIVGCTQEAPQAPAPLPTPFVSTSTPVPVQTTVPTAPPTVAPTPTIGEDCTRNLYAYGGTCTAVSRRISDMMSDCSVYGEHSPQCDRTCINYGAFTVRRNLC